MDIQTTRQNEAFVLTLAGRLDATWAEPVQAALDAAVRAGEHRIVMDFAGVDYISSAGLRVVIAGYKQLLAVKGGFAVRNAQPGVAKVIELSGLGVLLAAPESAPAVAAVSARCFETACAKWEAHGVASGMRLHAVGRTSAFDVAAGEAMELSRTRFGLGIAGLAPSRETALPQVGEFLCAAGCAAQMPASGASRPDFQLAEHAFIPTGWLFSGLVAEGVPGLLLRFDVRPDFRGVTLREIAATALEASGGVAAVFVMVAEVAGLVGAFLRQPPYAVADPFAFPEIRDRLSFTSERSHRDTTCLLVGVAAQPGSAWDERLRPLGTGPELLGHVHAAVFPYRAIPKGVIALDETVRGLFEAGGLNALLHLLNDTREPDGSGDSEFHRGACWVAPISNES